MQFDYQAFQSLDLGSPDPTSVQTETIKVEITNERLFGDFAKAFINEAHRVNFLKASQLTKERDDEFEWLSVSSLSKYFDFLLYQRILSVENNCPLWRKLKVLYIPAWIQYCLAMIGEVNLRDRGLRLIPTFNAEDVISFDQALKVSELLGSLENDLQIVRDAMPRGIEGDKDVMSTALIAGYVRSIFKVEHVASTYVTRFLGMKLQEEMAMATLYRVQYDDAAFIASALMTQKGLY